MLAPGGWLALVLPWAPAAPDVHRPPASMQELLHLHARFGRYFAGPTDRASTRQRAVDQAAAATEARRRAEAAVLAFPEHRPGEPWVLAHNFMLACEGGHQPGAAETCDQLRREGHAETTPEVSLWVATLACRPTLSKRKRVRRCSCLFPINAAAMFATAGPATRVARAVLPALPCRPWP